MLHAPSQDSQEACKLITVVTNQAASAAASLLSAGDYAIAGPNSLIHFHGVRMYRGDAITVEKASDAAKNLKASNDRSAVVLARNCSRKFFFRFISLRHEFPEHRAKHPEAANEKQCFLDLISKYLSPLGKAVVKSAEGRVKRYESLTAAVLADAPFDEALTKLPSSPQNADFVDLEAAMLRAIIAFEKQANAKRDDWRFSTDGLSRVNDDFVLLNEYIGQHKNDWIEEFCEQWKDFILQDGDKTAIEQLPEEQRKSARVKKLAPILLPLWLFLVSVCHVLHEAESPLTPIDAFWLGLIDEVAGAPLPTLRQVVEMAGMIPQKSGTPRKVRSLPGGHASSGLKR